MRRATGWEPDWFEVESFRVITDDRSGVATLTDETGATVTTEATVKVLRGGKRVIATAEGNGPVNALDRALRTRSTAASRRSSACTSPTTRCACSTRRRAPARSRGC